MLPERGTFYLEGDQEGTGILENANGYYTHALNFSGQAKFTYTVSDGSGSSALGQLIITVNPADDPPTVSNPPAAVTVNEDAANSNLDLSKVFTNAEDDPITLSTVSNSNRNLVTPTLNGNTLTLAYTPNQTGSATITIRATAADGETVETSFTVTVNSSTAIPIFSPFGLLALLVSLVWLGRRYKL